MSSSNKGGRTKLSNEEKREKVIYLRLNASEYDIVLKKFDKSIHKDLAPFVREMIVKGQMRIVTRDASRDQMLYDLGKVTTNINQIAHRLNMDSAPRLGEKDYDTLESLRDILLKYKF